MTVTHLFFALVTTAYILIAIELEERDLMEARPEYKQYRKQVPMLIPGLAKRATISRHKPPTSQQIEEVSSSHANSTP